MKTFYSPAIPSRNQAKCPNCLQEFNILDKDAKMEEFIFEGETIKLMVCGRCFLDKEHVQEKIDIGIIDLKSIDKELEHDKR